MDRGLDHWNGLLDWSTGSHAQKTYGSAIMSTPMSAHPYFVVMEMEPRNLFNENFVDSYISAKFKSYTVDYVTLRSLYYLYML